MGNLTDDPAELYRALAWKNKNDKSANPERAQKIASLCEWYELNGFFTEKQIDFGNQLLQEQ